VRIQSSQDGGPKHAVELMSAMERLINATVGIAAHPAPGPGEDVTTSA
jgi:hypothetical protein